MEYNRRYIAILVIILGILMMAIIAYLLFFFKAPQSPEMDISGDNGSNQSSSSSVLPGGNTATGSQVTSKKNPQVIVDKEVNSEFNLKLLSASFAERFGSFSNQAGFANIRELKIFMSPKMSAWADSYIQDEIAKHADSSTYYGITTKAIAETIKNYSEPNGTASVMVSTQRMEISGASGNTKRFSQDILLALVKVGDDWKVNSAYWQIQK